MGGELFLVGRRCQLGRIVPIYTPINRPKKPFRLTGFTGSRLKNFLVANWRSLSLLNGQTGPLILMMEGALPPRDVQKIDELNELGWPRTFSPERNSFHTAKTDAVITRKIKGKSELRLTGLVERNYRPWPVPGHPWKYLMWNLPQERQDFCAGAPERFF